MSMVVFLVPIVFLPTFVYRAALYALESKSALYPPQSSSLLVANATTGTATGAAAGSNGKSSSKSKSNTTSTSSPAPGSSGSGTSSTTTSTTTAAQKQMQKKEKSGTIGAIGFYDPSREGKKSYIILTGGESAVGFGNDMGRFVTCAAMARLLSFEYDAKIVVVGKQVYKAWYSSAHEEWDALPSGKYSADVQQRCAVTSTPDWTKFLERKGGDCGSSTDLPIFLSIDHAGAEGGGWHGPEFSPAHLRQYLTKVLLDADPKFDSRTSGRGQGRPGPKQAKLDRALLLRRFDGMTDASLGFRLPEANGFRRVQDQLTWFTETAFFLHKMKPPLQKAFDKFFELNPRVDTCVRIRRCVDCGWTMPDAWIGDIFEAAVREYKWELETKRGIAAATGKGVDWKNGTMSIVPGVSATKQEVNVFLASDSPSHVANVFEARAKEMKAVFSNLKIRTIGPTLKAVGGQEKIDFFNARLPAMLDLEVLAHCPEASIVGTSFGFLAAYMFPKDMQRKVWKAPLNDKDCPSPHQPKYTCAAELRGWKFVSMLRHPLQNATIQLKRLPGMPGV